MATQSQKWLRNKKKEDGLTGKEMAALIGISPSLVWFYLRDERRPGYDIMQRIKDAFDVDMNELFE